MAREHARVKLSIWDDDEFRQLSPAAQHLYFLLLTSPKLDYCGVTDWRPARIAQFAGGWTAWAVEVAAQELSEQRYIVIDTDSEEVLLRSFVRNDELLEQPNLAVAMKKAHTSIASSALRGIVIHELIRLHQDRPELKGWSRVPDMLERASLDPSNHPTFEASDNPSGNPFPIPSGNPSGWVSPTTATTTSPSTAPATPTGKTDGDNLGEERPVTLQPANATEPPDEICTRHPDGNPKDEPCQGCKAVNDRKARRIARLDAKARRELEQAIRECPDCLGSLWHVNPDGSPVEPPRQCSHRNARKTA